MNKKLLLGLLLVLLLIHCIALADTCDICGDAPTVWKGEAVDVTEFSHIKTCEHGVEYTFNHSYDNVLHHNNGSTHWEICEECGHHGYVSGHTVKCTNKNVCQFCGISCTVDNESVQHNESSGYSYDATRHYLRCSDCGEISEDRQHFADCRTPNVCMQCNYDNCSNATIIHNYDNHRWETDETSHWIPCEVCGVRTNENKHSTYCNNPGKCAECGIDYTGPNLYHIWDFDTVCSDETYHWNPCKNCDARINEFSHYRNCNSSKCGKCGSDYNGDRFLHNFDSEHYVSDANSHWNACTLCGEKINEGAHYRDCNKEVCLVCGTAYTGARITGHTIDEYESDDTHHWYKCALCGKDELEKEAHFARCDSPNKCNICGHAYSGDDISHDLNWNEFISIDAEYHTYKCRNCSYVEKEAHYSSCDTNGTCNICGTNFIDPDPGHYFSTDQYDWDENYHWNPCSKCDGYVNKSRHYALCSNPGVCAECKASYTGNTISHDIDFSTYYSDDTQHWRKCKNCAANIDYCTHLLLCTDKNSGKCADCGAAYTGDAILHTGSGWDTWYNDEKYHWWICSACKEKQSYSEHSSSCNAPGKCSTCGAVYSGSEVSHTFADDDYEFDADFHWHKCQNCSYVDKVEHHALCSANGTCYTCGADFTDFNPDHYYISLDQFDWDDTYHWNPCSKCDGYVNKFKHYALCTNPGVCAECKQPYSGSEIRHEGLDWDNYAFDENHHWLACANCDAHVSESPHFAVCSEPGKCRRCGADYTGENSGHVFNEKTDHNETYHWAICDACGALGKKIEHYASCQAPGVCDGCGIAYAGNNVEHSPTYYRFNDTKHWSICLDCGNKCLEGEHMASCRSNGRCEECDYPVASGEIRHFTTWNRWKSDSNQHWQICNVCSEVVNKAAHNSTITSHNDPTCNTAGMTSYSCDICEKTWSETIPATGNHSEVIDSRTPATCLVDGSITYKCSVCGESRIETIPAAGSHSEVIDNQTPATCLVDGSITYKCSVCGETRTEVIKAAGKHEEVVDRGRQATCTEIGYTDGTHCGVCDEVLVARQTIPMLEHDWQQGEVTAATCTTDGKTMFACSACEATKEEAIPATGHQFGAYRSLNNGTHAAECENGCGETRVRDCDYENVASGLFTYSTCKVCAYTKYSVLPTKEPEASVEPTATPAPNGEATADTDAPTQPESSETPAQPEATEAPASTLEPEVETALVKLVEEIAAAPETVEIKQVENAAIAPVPAANDETEEAPAAVIPENAQLIVHEQALPQESTSLPGARLFHIALSVDGYAVEHTGTVQIELPAPEVIDHAVMRLVLLQPDGSMIEIPYEIIDGKLVFHTDLLGVFALVPVVAI